MISKINVAGFFRTQAIRPDGSVRWKQDFPNGVTNLGFNLNLDSTFRSASITPISTWYIGLISNVSYTGISATDTMASHPGWTEDTTHYTPAMANTRPVWTPGAAANKQITNPTSVNFAINADNTIIKGIFVVSDSSLGGTAGFLWSAGLFTSDQTLYNQDTLKVTYGVALS